jgi:hypothetical protein
LWVKLVNIGGVEAVARLFRHRAGQQSQDLV